MKYITWVDIQMYKNEAKFINFLLAMLPYFLRHFRYKVVILQTRMFGITHFWFHVCNISKSYQLDWPETRNIERMGLKNYNFHTACAFVNMYSNIDNRKMTRFDASKSTLICMITIFRSS